jgi:hypothetical protein
MLRVALATIALAGCGADDPSPTTIKVGACDGTETVVPNEQGIHVAGGTEIAWSTNPPVTGMHFQVWGAWDREYAMLPRGNYVHNLEHGGIVLLHNCPAGCPDVVEQLRQVVRDFDTDSTCAAPLRNRFIITGDPLLPEGIQVAALSWNNLWTAGCFDPHVNVFAAAHYNEAPEDLCVDGANFGGTMIE